MDFYLRKREKIISWKRRMAEEVKPIYKRFTDRYIACDVFLESPLPGLFWKEVVEVRGSCYLFPFR